MFKPKKNQSPSVAPVSEHTRSLKAILGTFFVEVARGSDFVLVKRCASYSEALQYGVGLLLSSSEPIKVLITVNASSAGRSEHRFYVETLGNSIHDLEATVRSYLSESDADCS